MPVTLTNGAAVSNTVTNVTTATDITLTAPATNSQPVGVWSNPYTVALHGGSPPQVSATVTVTPDDGGAGGSFSPSTVLLSSSNPIGTFQYKNPTAGTKTISISNNSASVL